MRKLILFSLFIFAAINVSAQKTNSVDTFKITQLKCGNIIAGKDNLVEGSKFTKEQILKWKGIECDEFEALWLHHNRYVTFGYKKNENGYGVCYVKTDKTLHKSVETARECLTDTFYALTDTLFVKPCEVMNDNNYFILHYNDSIYRIPTLDENIFFIKLSDYNFEFDEENSVRLRISIIRKDEEGNEVEESVTYMEIIKL